MCTYKRIFKLIVVFLIVYLEIPFWRSRKGETVY